MENTDGVNHVLILVHDEYVDKAKSYSPNSPKKSGKKVGGSFGNREKKFDLETVNLMNL